MERAGEHKKYKSPRSVELEWLCSMFEEVKNQLSQINYIVDLLQK